MTRANQETRQKHTTRRALLGLAIVAMFVSASPATGEPDVLRIGLTAVVVRENLRFFDRWATYLSARIGRPVNFIQRRAYRDIMDLLGKGDLDVAWICGFPFVQKRDPEFLQLLVAPVYRGKPLYRSYVIVHRDSSFQDIKDLKGRIFAYSDPNSNSGYLVPRKMIQRAGLEPDRFFRLTFFTFSHADTVQAVADRVADAGAVDSYVWEFLVERQPKIAKQTRVIKRSERFGFPPIVIRLDVAPALRKRIEMALVGMADEPQGRALLQALMLDGFVTTVPNLYEPIRILAAAKSSIHGSPKQ